MTPKRKEEFLAFIAQQPNEGLLEDVLEAAGGDDYDGYFTKDGWWTFEVSAQELRKRLVAVGFLPTQT